MLKKQDLKDFSKEELKQRVTSCGYPAYRAIQVFRWLHKEGVTNFDGMRNLPIPFREGLSKSFYISSHRLLDLKRSKLDDTAKYLLKLEDSHAVEAVYLHEAARTTVCVSSQVGCKRSCAFCASSGAAFVRNLGPAEILNEVMYVARDKAFSPTRIVFMGVGEPFDNYDNVMKAVRTLNDPDGMNIGARKITISTCGIIPGIKRLSHEALQVELSVSLHSADNKIRSKLVPINKRYPLEGLMRACREYTQKTGRVITFEYVMIKGMNCSLDWAAKLVKLLKGLKCKVNLITYNQINPVSPDYIGTNGVKALGYEAPLEEEARAFLMGLKAKAVNATLRRSKGEDIDAGCGQLRILRPQDA